MKNNQEKVLEVQVVINDIVKDAEKGRITWDEALREIKNELGEIEE